MAGSGLIAIKRRIKSVTSTKKITKAMGLVATAKLRKVKGKIEFLDSFYDSINSTMEKVLDNHTGVNIYKSGNEDKHKLYIILTSDSGLCGSFNGNVLKKAEEELANDYNNNYVIVAGQKGSNYFKKTKYDVKFNYNNISDVPELKDVNGIFNTALQMYINNEVGQINIIYTKFISQAKQEVIVEKLLPLKDSSKDDNQDDFVSGDYVEFQPDTDKLLNGIVNLYLKQKILDFMTHSKTSEQAIKMSAMDGATKNANELLDKLKLEYNRMRQGAITQEISEIVGGSEAQK